LNYHLSIQSPPLAKANGGFILALVSAIIPNMDDINTENKKEDKEIQQTKGVAILIDGNNFCKNLEQLGFYNPLEFNFNDFIKFLAQDSKIILARYYKGGVIKELNNPKSETMFSNQQKLFSHLEKNAIQVEMGNMMKYPEFKKCEGFYPINKKIKNPWKLKIEGYKILTDNKTCYHPIILITSDFPLLEKLDKGKINKFSGLYSLSNNWKEKGVDVKIAVDILTLARDDSCQSIILLSSDSDLLPAIKKAQEVGKPIEYVGFGEKGCYHSIELLKECGGKLITKKDIEKFFPKTLGL